MSAWSHEVWLTLQSEFSDLPDAERVTRVIVRLLVALLLGAIVGYERELRGTSAGLRTHMLVALGAALFVIVPLQAEMEIAHLSRVLQGVITGVGFLGAGAILKQSRMGEVKGLTTAAGVWVTAAIGVCAGMGQEATAILSAILALIVLMLSRAEEDTRDR